MRFSTLSRAFNSEICAQIFHDFQTSRHRATERATDPDMRFPGRMLAEHWITRDHLENIDGLETEFFRDPEDRFIADEAEVFLPQVQKRHRRAAATLAGI